VRPVSVVVSWPRTEPHKAGGRAGAPVERVIARVGIDGTAIAALNHAGVVDHDIERAIHGNGLGGERLERAAIVDGRVAAGERERDQLGADRAGVIERAAAVASIPLDCWLTMCAPAELLNVTLPKMYTPRPPLDVIEPVFVMMPATDPPTRFRATRNPTH
jgi:hypothetical protein